MFFYQKVAKFHAVQAALVNKFKQKYEQKSKKITVEPKFYQLCQKRTDPNNQSKLDTISCKYISIFFERTSFSKIWISFENLLYCTVYYFKNQCHFSVFILTKPPKAFK